MGSYYAALCLGLILLVGLLPAMVMAWRYAKTSPDDSNDDEKFFIRLVPIIWFVASLIALMVANDNLFTYFAANLPGAFVIILGGFSNSAFHGVWITSNIIIWLLCNLVYRMGATPQQFLRPIKWLFFVTFLVIASPLLDLASNGYFTPEGLRLSYLPAACNLSIFFHLIGLIIVLGLRRMIPERISD